MFNFFKKKEPKEKKPVKEKANYIKYTQSATLDTLDFIKKLLNVVDIINQFLYIGYLTYRLISNVGYLALNIILLVLTLGHLIFHLATLREFYTKEQRQARKIVREVTKWSKRAISVIIISLSIVRLAQNGPTVSFVDILMTLLMILGFIFSIISEVAIKTINSRAALIKNAVLYDIEEFKKGDSFIVKVINKQLKEVLSLIPEVESEEMRAKLEEVYKKQNDKNVRKHEFHLKHRAKEKDPKLIEAAKEEKNKEDIKKIK